VRGVVIAGGKGTRIASVTGGRNKCLLEVGGIPLLSYHIRALSDAGCKQVDILIGPRRDPEVDVMAASSEFRPQLRILTEPSASGSGGCLQYLPRDPDPSVILFGDLMLDMDLQALVSFHASRQASATVVVHPNDHPLDSDLLEMDESDRAVCLHRKPHRANLLLRNLSIAGVFVIEDHVLTNINGTVAKDLTQDIVGGLLSNGDRVNAYRSTEYIKDIGTPTRYHEVLSDYEHGLIRALRRDKRQRAAFLDRDGTIVRACGYISRPEQIELLPGAARAIRLLNRAGVRTIVVTNQPVVARGLCSERDLACIHSALEMALGREGAYLDDVYYCPHHPDKGFPGENIDYKISCDCRKPSPGMLVKAIENWNIDVSQSAMFGDSPWDVEAARRVGLRAYFINEAGPMQETIAGKASNLEEAVVRWLSDG
jgi:mannose-1-phosphate guanylyltransferase/phosphomannomutase